MIIEFCSKKCLFENNILLKQETKIEIKIGNRRGNSRNTGGTRRNNRKRQEMVRKPGKHNMEGITMTIEGEMKQEAFFTISRVLNLHKNRRNREISYSQNEIHLRQLMKNFLKF